MLCFEINSLNHGSFNVADFDSVGFGSVVFAGLYLVAVAVVADQAFVAVGWVSDDAAADCSADYVD